jgi:hypothetical protein
MDNNTSVNVEAIILAMLYDDHIDGSFFRMFIRTMNICVLNFYPMCRLCQHVLRLSSIGRDKLKELILKKPFLYTCLDAMQTNDTNCENWEALMYNLFSKEELNQMCINGAKPVKCNCYTLHDNDNESVDSTSEDEIDVNM